MNRKIFEEIGWEILETIRKSPVLGAQEMWGDTRYISEENKPTFRLTDVVGEWVLFELKAGKYGIVHRYHLPKAWFDDDYMNHVNSWLIEQRYGVRS